MQLWCYEFKVACLHLPGERWEVMHDVAWSCMSDKAYSAPSWATSDSIFFVESSVIIQILFKITISYKRKQCNQQ